MSLIFAFFFLINYVFAAQINSTNYEQVVIVSAGGENISSSSYNMGIAAGIISKVVSSSSYINRLGFFNLFLLADGRPCASASQCQGGFCCSNLCSSSSCPVSTTTSTSGGGTGGGGGGGGGGGSLPSAKPPIPVKEFSVSPSSIKEELALGAASTRTFRIKNTGSEPMNFDLELMDIGGFVALSDISFSIGPGEEKVVEAGFIGKKLGSYIGKILVRSDEEEKSIIAVVDISSDQALFDAKLDIPPAYKEVEQGGELKAQITLLNVGSPKKVDVAVTYLIKDTRGNVIHESSETFAVEKQTSYVKSFKLGEKFGPEDYLVIAEVRYGNLFAVSSELFKIIPKQTSIKKSLGSSSTFKYISALALLIGVLLVLALTPLDRFLKRIFNLGGKGRN
ncbi:hypothetical protein HYS31_01910 [Candidatus Woesearchaeota archaeon]|nr:hypothetical protein [Candidatus Woesearchaeota archaeon]